MRRLGMFAFLTIAFCPSIGLLLMLAYAVMADGLDWFSSPADLMLLGLWGWLSCCWRRPPYWVPSTAPNIGARTCHDGCCLVLVRKPPAPRSCQYAIAG